jgi:ankyrin repeat protein
MPERVHLFRLIQKGDKLASIEEALSHDPGLALIRDKNGDTPLHYAAACHEADVAKLLLAYHADVNALDDNHWTPLDEAGWAQAKDVVRILRENGGHF